MLSASLAAERISARVYPREFTGYFNIWQILRPIYSIYLIPTV